MKHFSPGDMVSRWVVLEVRARPTSLGPQFLIPFRRRPQFNSSSELAGEFERACQQQQGPCPVCPPALPPPAQLNGHVERVQRTHTEEFHEVTPDRWSVPELNCQLRTWDQIRNTVRPQPPHPTEFVSHWQSQRKDLGCH